MADIHAAWARSWPALRRYAYAVAHREHVPGMDEEDVAAELLVRAWTTVASLGLHGWPHWGAIRQNARWHLRDLRRRARARKRIPESAMLPLTRDRELAALPTDATGPQHPHRHMAPWTPVEDDAIRDRLGIIGYRALAGELGRSVRALQERASELGVRRHPRGRDGRPREWSESEEEYLRMVVAKAAQQTGKTPGAVASRIAGMYKRGKIGLDSQVCAHVE